MAEATTTRSSAASRTALGYGQIAHECTTPPEDCLDLPAVSGNRRTLSIPVTLWNVDDVRTAREDSDVISDRSTVWTRTDGLDSFASLCS